jgi:hypothetical protein
MAQAHIEDKRAEYESWDRLSQFLRVKVINPGRIDFATIPENCKIPVTIKSMSGLVFDKLVTAKGRIDELLENRSEDMFQLHEHKWLQVKPFGDQPYTKWYVGFMTLNNKGQVNGRYSMNLTEEEWSNLEKYMVKLQCIVEDMKSSVSKKTLMAKSVRGYKWRWVDGNDEVLCVSDHFYYTQEHAKAEGMVVWERDLTMERAKDPVTLTFTEQVIELPAKLDWIETLYMFALKAAVGKLKVMNCSGCGLDLDKGEIEHKKEGGCQDDWMDHTTDYYDEAYAMVSETSLSDLFQYCWTTMGKKPENLMDLLIILKRVKNKEDMITQVKSLNVDTEDPKIALITAAYKAIHHVTDVEF